MENMALEFERERLTKTYGPPVLTKPQLDAEYESITEFPPFVLVIKKADKERGTFQFKDTVSGRIFYNYARTTPWTPSMKGKQQSDELPPYYS